MGMAVWTKRPEDQDQLEDQELVGIGFGVGLDLDGRGGLLYLQKTMDSGMLQQSSNSGPERGKLCQFEIPNPNPNGGIFGFGRHKHVIQHGHLHSSRSSSCSSCSSHSSHTPHTVDSTII